MPLYAPSYPSGMPQGTSFPVSPSNGDFFQRTDRNLSYFYNGTRWLSSTLYTMGQDSQGALVGSADTFSLFGANPWAGVYDLWLEHWIITSVNSLATPASNYFVMALNERNGSASAAIGSTISTQNDTENVYFTRRQALNVVLSSAVEGLQVTCTETGVQNAVVVSALTYRLIG